MMLDFVVGPVDVKRLLLILTRQIAQIVLKQELIVQQIAPEKKYMRLMLLVWQNIPHKLLRAVVNGLALMNVIQCIPIKKLQIAVVVVIP